MDKRDETKRENSTSQKTMLFSCCKFPYNFPVN